MGGGKGGGGGGGGAQSPYDSALAKIAGEEYERARPLRDAYMRQFQELVGGNFDAKTSPMYQPIFSALRSAAGQGESQARDAILAGTARGGGQTASLANLALTSAKDRAGAESGTISQIINDLMNKSYGLASGSPASAMQGYGSAGQIGAQNQMASLQAQQMQSAAGAGLGGGLGTAAGAGLGWALAPATGGMSAIAPYLLGGALLGGGAGRGIGGKK